jgi:excisionase family DNA binding protein
MSEPERATIERAVEILGLPVRTVQKMAQRGDIPGAARFGRRWSFNMEKLRGFVRHKEREIWQGQRLHRAVTGAVPSSGAKLKLKVAASDGRLTQTIQSLRASVAKPAKPARKPS